MAAAYAAVSRDGATASRAPRADRRRLVRGRADRGDARAVVQRHRQPALRLRGVRERRELHLDLAREHFALRGLQGEFILHDAEALPFDDETFDVVTSSVGAIFAPRTYEVESRAEFSW